MEQDAQTDVLYDFLYRDSSRINSYYAQIFGGKLTSVQNTETERDSADKGGKLDLGMVGGDLKSGKENTLSQTRVIDPHDLTATDVFIQLRANNRFNENAKAAPHGSLILASGTLLLIDRTMLEMATAVLDSQAKEASRTAKTPSEKNAARAQQSLIPIMKTLSLPSGFLLHTADGLDIVGTVKETGMEEPISTYYFKHGTAGLAQVYLIGIKEQSSLAITLSAGKLIGMAQAAAAGLQQMMFPDGAITVTPIAIFREI